MGGIALAQHDVSAHKQHGKTAQNQPAEQPHPHLLADEAQLFPGGDLLVHQHADGDSQRLRSHISRHIQDQRLERHNDRQPGHDLLECAYNA